MSQCSRSAGKNAPIRLNDAATGAILAVKQPFSKGSADMYDMSRCELCPRRCGADRQADKRGACGVGQSVLVARAAPHYWEEPCISGKNGSGTVFFAGCSLGCVFCQNRRISRSAVGAEQTVGELANTFLRLQDSGVHNINLVTPTHYVPQIAAALDIAKLHIPVVYNSGGYDLPETLDMLDGKVRVFLPDFKYMDSALAARFSRAADYPDAAKTAVAKMFELAGRLRFDTDGMMKSGVIVRHLVLPGHADDSINVIDYLHRTYGDSIYISIMNQYTPPDGVSFDEPLNELNRAVTDAEYARVVDYAESIGVCNAFIQEGGTVSESFIPPFDV